MGIRVSMSWSPRKAGTQTLAHRQVLSCFPNTLSGPFWRHQYFREGKPKGWAQTCKCSSLTFCHSPKAGADRGEEMSQCNRIFQPYLDPRLPQRTTSVQIRLVSANSTSQTVSPHSLRHRDSSGLSWLHWCSWKGMVWWKGIKVLISCYWVQGIECPVDFDTAWKCSVPLKPCNRVWWIDLN